MVVAHDDDAFRLGVMAALARERIDAVGFAEPMTALAAFDDPSRHFGVLVTCVNFIDRHPHGISLALMARMKRPTLQVIIVGSQEHAAPAKGIGVFLLKSVDRSVVVGHVAVA